MLSNLVRTTRFPLTSLLAHSSKWISRQQICSVSTDKRPLMLMDLPRIVYPNLILTMKNFFARVIISGYFDSTFAIQPFTEGARQALTVVSCLIANGQFDDLSSFLTKEVIDEVKRNYLNLTPEQRLKIPVEESEIVFSYPYLIGLIMNDETKSRQVEITMIFHVLKNREAYRQEMLENTQKYGNSWVSAMQKMRENIIVCNYKFLRDMSKDSQDDSWTITGLNHWMPSEYEEKQV